MSFDFKAVAEWAFRLLIIFGGLVLSAQQRNIDQNQKSIERNQEAIRSNLIAIERINASRYTPADALHKEREENAWRSGILERVGRIETDVQVIRAAVEGKKP